MLGLWGCFREGCKDAAIPILSKDAQNKGEPARLLGLFPPYPTRIGRGARDHAKSLAVTAFCLHTQRQSHKEGYGIKDGKDKNRNGEAASPRWDLFHLQRFRPWAHAVCPLRRQLRPLEHEMLPRLASAELDHDSCVLLLTWRE